VGRRFPSLMTGRVDVSVFDEKRLLGFHFLLKLERASRTACATASALVSFGRHPVPRSFAVSRTIRFTSPFQPPPATPPVQENATSERPISRTMISAISLTLIAS